MRHSPSFSAPTFTPGYVFAMSATAALRAPAKTVLSTFGAHFTKSAGRKPVSLFCLIDTVDLVPRMMELWVSPEPGSAMKRHSTATFTATPFRRYVNSPFASHWSVFVASTLSRR